MYGLPLSGILAQQLPEKRLNSEVYRQDTLVPGLWTHLWSPVTFTLGVDDCGVDYVGDQQINHLMTVLNRHYTISNNWTGSHYLGLDLDWDYEKREVHLSTLSCVQDALTRFYHFCPNKPQYQPYPHAKITYVDRFTLPRT